MLKFNLLPPQEKRELEMSNFNRLITSLLIWFFVFLITFGVLLASAYYSLSIIIDGQEKLVARFEGDENIGGLLELEEKIKNDNTLIKELNKKQEGIVLWTPILEEFSRITTEGLYLTNLNYQKEEEKVSIAGRASSRDKLLEFENKLKKSSYFVEVESPFSNLIKQTDINFSFILCLVEKEEE